MSSAVLNKRTNDLFELIVREYIKQAEPVGSEYLRQKYQLDLSPATIRNEMAVLETAGFLCQPHTSAGRAPTEAGYRYYVEHCLIECDVRVALENVLRSIKHLEAEEARLKEVARELARDLQESVFVGFAPRDTYYTGLSHLFGQPEFERVDLVRHLSGMVDNLDQIVGQLFEDNQEGVQVYIGSENPFGQACSSVVLKIDAQVLGVLGPVRMDYDRAVAIMKGIEGIMNREL